MNDISPGQPGGGMDFGIAGVGLPKAMFSATVAERIGLSWGTSAMCFRRSRSLSLRMSYRPAGPRRASDRKNAAGDSAGWFFPLRWSRRRRPSRRVESTRSHPAAPAGHPTDTRNRPDRAAARAAAWEDQSHPGLFDFRLDVKNFVDAIHPGQPAAKLRFAAAEGLQRRIELGRHVDEENQM